MCIVCSFASYVNILTESTDCILLPSLALQSVLLTSLVNTLCFLFLSFWCDFTVNLLFLVNYFSFSLRLSILKIFGLFTSFSSWFASKQCLKNFVWWHTFLWLLLFCFHFCCLLNSYMFLISMRQTQSLFSHLIYLSLIQLLFYFFL